MLLYATSRYLYATLRYFTVLGTSPTGHPKDTPGHTRTLKDTISCMFNIVTVIRTQLENEQTGFTQGGIFS